MNNLITKLNHLKKLDHLTIALDISELNKQELETLIGRTIYEETKYLIFIANKGIEYAHQEHTLEAQVIDYIIKLS